MIILCIFFNFSFSFKIERPLSILYARLSTNSSEPTEKEKATSDVNNDGLIDSADASKVLAYYAYISANDTIELEAFLSRK